MAKKDAKQAPKADKVKKPSAPPDSSSESFNAGVFVQGTQEELTKVIWPTRQQLISESAAVILMVSLSATLIYFIDKLFGWASRQVF
ncbi:MAG: preprotein translocase subunit SecE [Leptolyngbya foveolarum]|uniref:Preprotein translocase subunit SecE n=1 Tax=Leptolyngbya foveolarum TaxID=47253 RepID=A0A2W4WBQ1_9CYAN|nr:MAG: preprotein translocase subunit SecE [Leptolyngbya foveolarum]